MKLITLEDLDQWSACEREDGGRYSDERIKRLAGDGPWTPLEVAEAAWVSCEDRLWVLLRPEVIGGELCREAANAYADRAVRKYALDHPATREWAEQWLSGEDRTVAAAERAAAAVGVYAHADIYAHADAYAAAHAAAYAAHADAYAAAIDAADAADAYAPCAAEHRWQLAWLKKRLREAARDGEQ